MLGVVGCGTSPLSRIRARAPPVQHLLRVDYKRGLYAFQGGQRHPGRFGAKNGARGSGGKQLPESQSWRRRFGTCFMLTMLGHLAITRAAEEDDGGDSGRVRGVWPHRIAGQD